MEVDQFECPCEHFCRYCAMCLFETCDDNAGMFMWTADCLEEYHDECLALLKEEDFILDQVMANDSKWILAGES